jgi:hypothetical protein
MLLLLLLGALPAAHGLRSWDYVGRVCSGEVLATARWADMLAVRGLRLQEL